MKPEDERNPTTDLLDEILRSGHVITDRRPPWQWCEQHVESIPYSPVPGGFQSGNSPWIREPLEALADPSVSLVSIIAAIQAGKTMTAELGSCWIAANAPGPMLWLDQTDSDAKDQMENRLQVLWKQCAPIREILPRQQGTERHKLKRNSVAFLNGMTGWVLGAHSKTNLQRRSIRWLIGDETWRWPSGHMAEAEARVTAFGWLGKRFFVSQAGEVDDDTDRKFRSTDQREWCWRCPSCKTTQPWKWENIEWSKDCRLEDGAWDYERVRETTEMFCECGTRFPDTDRSRRELNNPMNGARYVSQNPGAAKSNIGFHWNGLCAGSWGNLAEIYLRAKASARTGDMEQLKIFWQKRLALPFTEYTEDFSIKITDSTYARGDLAWEKEGAIIGGKIRVPDEDDDPPVRLRVMTVDVQMDHFWWLITQWSPDGSSRRIDWGTAHTWEELLEQQEKYRVSSSLVGVDAGFNSYEVYQRCAEHGWVALMGDRKATWTHRLKQRLGVGVRVKSLDRFYSPKRSINCSAGKVAQMFYWSNLNIKDALSRIRRNQDPSRGPTWEVPVEALAEVDNDEKKIAYLSQMESEMRIKDGDKWQWSRIQKRPNHLLDCEAMATVFAFMLKILGRETEQEAAED